MAPDLGGGPDERFVTFAHVPSWNTQVWSDTPFVPVPPKKTASCEASSHARVAESKEGRAPVAALAGWKPGTETSDEGTSEGVAPQFAVEVPAVRHDTLLPSAGPAPFCNSSSAAARGGVGRPAALLDAASAPASEFGSDGAIRHAELVTVATMNRSTAAESHPDPMVFSVALKADRRASCRGRAHWGFSDTCSRAFLLYMGSRRSSWAAVTSRRARVQDVEWHTGGITSVGGRINIRMQPNTSPWRIIHCLAP